MMQMHSIWSYFIFTTSTLEIPCPIIYIFLKEHHVQICLKPPETFEAWAGWLFHVADSKGNRISWFAEKERKWIGNLNYMSILSKTATNVMTTFADNNIVKVLYNIAKPVSKYFGWRLRNKYYNFVPEIKPIKVFQQYMFSSTNYFNTTNKDPVSDV
jgi:hypothetical protein